MRKTTHETQQNGEGVHSGYQNLCLHPWSNMVAITKYGFYFEYFYVSIGQYILRKMLKKR